MKYLLAFISPDLRHRVVAALVAAKAPGLTISEAHGFGQKHESAQSQLQDFTGTEMTRKLRLEILCHDGAVESLLQALYASAHTGHDGDGKIFVLDVADALRIKTGERGIQAIGS